MNDNPETDAKPIDISFFFDKYLIPLIERKWIVIIFFLIAVSISLVIYLIIKPEYITYATVLIEEPRSQSSEIKKEGVGSEGASKGYVTAEGEKLKSSSFAAEVFRVLPDETKRDFESPLDLASQIMGQSARMERRLGVEEGSETSTYFLNEGDLLSEMFGRIDMRTDANSGLIYLSVKTLNPGNGPVILNSYIDVWQAKNLEENKRVARAESRFAEEQRNEAYQQFLKTQEEMISFKKAYDIPVELNMARDMELQSEMERLQSKHRIDKERFDYLDKIYLDTRMQEAGIQGNIKVISSPVRPASPSRSAAIRLMLTIIGTGLLLGVGLVLGIDYIKAPIRHENDIMRTVHIPILGQIPSI